MTLTSSEGFVIYRTPYSNKKYYRTGDWKEYSAQSHGFIIQSFDNQKSFILEAPKKELNDKNIIINFPEKKQTNHELSKTAYLEQLNTFIDASQRELTKVISSRIINQSVNQQFDLFQAFEKLASQQTNALVYILNIPNIGMWMGATPETLLKVSPTESYTIALAGSQKSDHISPWGKKEIQEHEYVIEDISQKLMVQQIKHIISDTETIVAGRVAHLKTKINIKTTLTNIKAIADTLHPTSAICGMPQENAYEFIIENEPYDREFYTGYLGELEDHNNAWIFVNLRCMQLFDHVLTLYVGGGITNDSNSEKEWEETQLKSQTLLAVIEKI
ncbi:MAG: chorismate-binding protein [Flavobacteriales bacterium]|jgi:isochorismate synthase|nr:chorismate-binding protein [Flavobacteriales bacterium]